MNEHTSSTVDLVFRLSGDPIPQEHGYPLFAALDLALGGIHDADWLAVHPILGIPRSDGKLAFSPRRSGLRLRASAEHIPRLLRIAGSSLTILGHKLEVGTSQIFPLRPEPHLASRTVTIKGYTEETEFLEAVEQRIQELGSSAKVELGRRRVTRIANHLVVGFGVKVRNLEPATSIKLQETGIGGRRHFGCGSFLPLRAAEGA